MNILEQRVNESFRAPSAYEDYQTVSVQDDILAILPTLK